ncbi:hypothetical protein SDC9_127958 [bioreactor metagenome]|uniref:Uncharacterized protein n=1 Tax=bioreactor metagenome TaxID=1076179 RepID=A0A645CVG8_9ZZZZ
MVKFCKETVRTIGYRGLCAQENFSKRLAQASVRAKWNDAVAMNSYWAHPVPIAFRRGSRISQESAVVSGADYFTGVAQTRLLGRPLFETEYCHSFWNRYEYEQILFPAYAAFQGFSGIMVHELPVVRQENRPLKPFSIGNNPTQRATQFLAACFYQRGDIRRSESMVTVGFRSRDLEELDLSLSLAASQRKIALLTGFSLDFKDSRVSGQPSSQLEIAPFAGGRTITRAFFNEIADGEDAGKFDLAEFVRKLRAQKIFKETNRSDPARGIFHSDTEQLFLDTGKGVLKIITPYSEGATLVRRGSVSLAALEEVKMPEPGLIGIASVDGLPLQESGRMVLVAVLSCVNSGMKLTADRTTVLEPGTTPVLLQTGTFHLKFRGRKDCDYTLYPLSVNGIRREPIPVENQNGSVSMQIDTAALRDGPTVFFELCAAAK